MTSPDDSNCSAPVFLGASLVSSSSFDGSGGSLADSKSGCGMNANSDGLKFPGSDGDLSRVSLDGIVPAIYTCGVCLGV
jgi:hypothetical protein